MDFGVQHFQTNLVQLKWSGAQGKIPTYSKCKTVRLVLNSAILNIGILVNYIILGFVLRFRFATLGTSYAIGRLWNTNYLYKPPVANKKEAPPSIRWWSCLVCSQYVGLSHWSGDTNWQTNQGTQIGKLIRGHQLAYIYIDVFCEMSIHFGHRLIF